MTFLHSTSTPLAHQVLELLAYFVGARLYFASARRQPRPGPALDRLLLVASAAFGAMLGSKLLHVAEHLPALRGQPLAVWLGGKSLLGGFLGGTAAVEMAKRSIAWKPSTGDAWVPAIVVGIIIGRIGCQLSGLWDQTYGNPTDLPWAWDYGDGVPRHPVAAYEIVLVACAWLGVSRMHGKAGQRFAALMAAYCLIRLCLEFLKPPFAVEAAGTLPTTLLAGLTAIQWAAIVGLGYFGWRVFMLRPADHGNS
ncbi:MAG TPA: prolipoprotein diacylglyceryl transferase family protein, partial [Caldimonas sp.]|nr:prolipoprotein diacylglyceryl transferase family protein [Caldimonas sp.]